MLFVSLAIETSPQPTATTLKLSTQRLARLLEAARQWDAQHPCFDGSQLKFLLDHFYFGDTVCFYASASRCWDSPRAVYSREHKTGGDAMNL